MANTVLQRRAVERQPTPDQAAASDEMVAQSRELSGAYRSPPIVRLRGMVQTKLTVGTPGDRYEREADAVAERVTAGRAAPAVSTIPPGGLAAQRSPDEEHDDEAADDDAQEMAQAKCSECDRQESPIQRMADPLEAAAPAVQRRSADDVQAKCTDCESGTRDSSATQMVQRQEDDSGDDAEDQGGDELAGAAPTADGAADARAAQPSDATKPGTERDDDDGGEGGEEPGGEEDKTPKEDLGCGDGGEDGDGGEKSEQDAGAAGGEKKACGASAPAAAGDEAEPVEDASAPEQAPAAQGEETEGGEAANSNCAPQATGPAAEKQPDPEAADEVEEPDVPETDDVAQAMVQLACSQCESEKTAQRRGQDEDVGPQPVARRDKKPAQRGLQTDVAASHLHARGPGEPLARDLRPRLESSMGVDLGAVRVHSDGNAQAASKALRAKAFTHKNHIFLGTGQSQHDVALMAHETTHVLQQSAIERKPAESKKEKEKTTAKEQEGEKEKAAGTHAVPGKKPEAKPAPRGERTEHAPDQPPKSPALAAAPPAAAARLTTQAPHAPAMPASARDKTARPASPTAAATAKESRDKGPVDLTKKSDTPEQTVHPPVAANVVRQAELRESTKLAERKRETAPGGKSAAVPGKQAAGDAKAADAAKEIAAAPKAGARASAASGASESVGAESAPAAEKAAKADPESDPRFQGTIKRLHRAATRERDHGEPDEKVQQAKGAVKAPDDEPRSHAANDNVADMATGADAAPAPKEKSFEDVLNEKLEEIRPKNMEQTLEFRESGAAGKLKNEVGKQIKQQKNDTVGPLQKATIAPLKTEKYPNPREKKLEPDPADPAQRSLHAEDVLPEPKNEEEVSVDKDRDEADRLMKENDLDEDQLKRANEPQFTAVVEAREKLEENSAKVVPAYRQEEAKLLNKGAKEVAKTSAHALGGMRGKRKNAKDKVLTAQDAARQKEEEERKTVAGNINSKFNATQSAVKARLDGLDSPVGTLFDIAEMVARQKFESTVDELMTAYKKDRYSGVSGKLAWGWDKLTGMPKEVDQFYVEGTKVYIASMKEAFRNIAKFVDAQLTLAKNDIAKGKKEITDYIAGLKGKQKEYGDTAFTAIEGDFAALESSVEDKKQGLAGDLVQKYKASRAALDERIDELKAENAGLLSKLVAFIKKVVAILKKLKDLAVMLLKVGGAVLRGIVKDPTGFLGNLIAAVKSGFAMFGEHIGRHLKDALISFVTGSMRDVGVSGTSEGGPGGIGGIVLQVLGLTPRDLKEKVAAKLGLRDPSLLEKAWSTVKTLFADGASALWAKLKEFVGNIREKVEEEIKEWIGIQIVKAGMLWIISLFNPVSALLRALKMIYDVVSFFVNNLDRIIDLVNGVLKSVSAVVAGNIAGAARMIESAAAKGLSLLLGFLAALLGLSGIGDKIRAIIQRVRTVIARAVDAILNVLLKPFKWLARKAAPLVARGKAAVKRGKAAVQRAGAAVARFLFPRRNFSGGGENHTLYFGGEGGNSPLMVASSPRTLLKFVGELRQRPENKSGKGKEALDRTTKHFAAIRQLQQELRRRPTKVGQERIDKEMSAIASILREILMRGDYATFSNPLPLVWTKPPSEHYQPLYLGPVLSTRRIILQATLEAAYNKGARMDARGTVADKLRAKNEAAIEAWEKKNMPIEKYLPHERKKTPDGAETLGLTPKWHIHEGRKLKLPDQKPPPSPGGGLINSTLAPYGYDPTAQGRDGDHVVEMQIGGEDRLENLWPLKSDVNRASGTNIRKQQFELEGGVSISMGELKELARRRKNPRTVWLKISKTG